MIPRTATLVAALALVVGAAACGDAPQVAGTQRKAGDTPPWAGTQSTTPVGGLKAGDQAAWTDQIRSRTQGQNDYARGGS